MKNTENKTQNYHQPQAKGEEQTVLTDPAVTSETDELDPAFPRQDPSVDPEDEESDDEYIDDEEVDDGDHDFDLNHDEDDDLSLNIDKEELY